MIQIMVIRKDLSKKTIDYVFEYLLKNNDLEALQYWFERDTSKRSYDISADQIELAIDNKAYHCLAFLLSNHYITINKKLENSMNLIPESVRGMLSSLFEEFYDE